MNCHIAQHQIDDYFDGQLHPIRQVQVDQHLGECAACRREYQLEREIRAAMHEIDEVPPLRAGFADRAFASLKASQVDRTRRGVIWGVGSAMAASLAVWLGVNGLFVGEEAQTQAVAHAAAPAPQWPVIKLNVDQVHPLRVAFSSPQTVEGVTLTLLLPPHLELSGYPDEREISWTTRLDAGQNVLELPVIAHRAMVAGEVVAKIALAQKEKIFRIRVEARNEGQVRAASPSGLQI